MRSILTTVMVLITTSIYAQKLATVQAVSLRAPANVKVDGKADDWGGKFQAYNPAVELSYSIANDVNNLYLILKTDKPRVFEKITAVGVTLTVNKKGVKDYKNSENATLTFPLLDVPTGLRIIAAAGIKSDNVINNIKGPQSMRITGLVYNETQTDSLKEVARQTVITASKTIKLTGFAGLPDTLSIYNEHNIIPALNYDKSGTYIYELQIPLKLLGISNQKTPFSYSIKLRSRLEDKKKGVLMIYKYDKNGDQVNVNQDLDADTDFWGEYTLAK